MTSTKQVARAIFWSCISAWYYGYHLAELNYPAEGLNCHPSPRDKATVLPPCIGLSAITYSTVTALLTAGGLLGSALSDMVVRKQGVAGAIAWTGWINLAGAFLMAAAPNWVVLGAGRFVSGLACGLAICLVPPYLATLARATPELAAKSGQVGTLFQLAIVIGIMSSQIMGMVLTGPKGNKPNRWRYVLVTSAIASIVQIVMSGKSTEEVAEAPDTEAQRTNDEAAPLLNESSPAGAAHGAPADQLSIRAVLSNPSIRGPALLVASMMVLQQLSGVNAVLFYSTPVLSTVLKGAGAGALSVGITVVNAFMTLPAIVLVDKLGRRTLLLMSAGTMGVMSVLLAIGINGDRAYLSSFAIVTFVAGFAIGLGPVPFLLISDLLPAHAVPATASLALSCSWISTFAIGMGFIPLRDALSEPIDRHDPISARKNEGNVFYVFTVTLSITILVVLRGIRN